MAFSGRAAKLLTTLACASALVYAQCNYPLRPPRRSINTGVLSGYSNFIFRIFAGGKQGTAFAIDPTRGYFLTAQHVIDAPDQDGIRGDFVLGRQQKFKFDVVLKLCKVPLQNEECRDAGDGTDPGVDLALMKMSPDSLSLYLSLIPSTQLPFDLSLSFQPADEAFKAGFPQENNSNIAPILNASDKMSVVMDWGIGDREPIHRQWKLDRAVSFGESGSPAVDDNGNIFAVMLEQDPQDANKGISISMVEAMQILEKVFIEMTRSIVGKRLGSGIVNNSYNNKADLASDLSPNSISNRELAAVILDVTANGSPQFNFRDCVDIALNLRSLDGIYGRWESDSARGDDSQKQTRQAVLFRDAEGLRASGQRNLAADRYRRALASDQIVFNPLEPQKSLEPHK